MSLCARIIDVEQRFMSDAPLPPYLITVVEIGRPLPKGSRSMGGTGLPSSFATFLAINWTCPRFGLPVSVLCPRFGSFRFLETSDFTGAKDRIDDLQAPADRAGNTHAWERSRGRRKSGWMSPLEIDERLDALGPDPDPTARRASRKGFLPISLARYLELLDWTGRQLRATKRGAIPSHLAPILTRLGMDSEDWCQVVGGFGRVFRRVAGTPASLQAEATRRGQRSMHAPGRRLFSAAA